MMSFLKKKWELLLIIVVFIVCKVPHLFYPYYWDESWPYAPAIKAMYQHGITLMPVVDPELSRGHPLFFHAAAATWVHIFGDSHVSMHSFALLISVLFLIAIYEAGYRLFNRRVAVVSLLLTATQILFFVQSSFVLFEILIPFLAFLSLYFYIRDKYVFTILCLTALFYTKESGLIMGFILGMDALIGLFRKNIEWKRRLYRFISIAVPCVLIGIFFLIQKHVRGWYIFPFYAGLVENNWLHFWYNFRMNCFRNTFVEDPRYYYYLLVYAFATIAAIKNKNLWYLTILIPAVIIYYFVDDMRTGRIMPSIPFFITFILSLVFLLYSFHKLHIYKNVQQERFIILTIAFIFCFCCFSSMNFFTYRYLLTIFIPFLFFTAVIYDVLIDRTYPALQYLVFIVIAFTFWRSYELGKDRYGDANFGAFDGMAMQQAVVNYFEKNNLYAGIISTGSFLERVHLNDPATGFLHGNKTFHVEWEINDKTDYVVFDNIESDYRYNSVKANPAFHLEHREQKGKVWVEIYKKN